MSHARHRSTPLRTAATTRRESKRPRASESQRSPTSRRSPRPRASPTPSTRNHSRSTERPARSLARSSSSRVSASPPPRPTLENVRSPRDDTTAIPPKYTQIHRTYGIYNIKLPINSKRVPFQDAHAKRYPFKRSRFSPLFSNHDSTTSPSLTRGNDFPEKDGSGRLSRVPSSVLFCTHTDKKPSSLWKQTLFM